MKPRRPSGRRGCSLSGAAPAIVRSATPPSSSRRPQGARLPDPRCAAHVRGAHRHRLGAILRGFPAEMNPTMLAWSRGDDLWKRRSSILCQLRFMEDTDLGLLYACIEPSLGSKEFFLRKAIGWALRQHARTDPVEVARWVKANEARLAPLRRRAALKNVARP